MRTKNLLKAGLLMALIQVIPVSGLAQDYFPEDKDEAAPEPNYSPYVDDHFSTQVFFGDTHLHTSWSTDAGLAGATLGPDEAYRVARVKLSGATAAWRSNWFVHWISSSWRIMPRTWA